MLRYELTYNLPGPAGGHRADPRSFDYPAPDTNEDGTLTAEAIAALHAAQHQLDEYVRFLVERGATSIRLNSDDLALNLPEVA